jgi:hypothetical protein
MTERELKMIEKPLELPTPKTTQIKNTARNSLSIFNPRCTLTLNLVIEITKWEYFNENKLVGLIDFDWRPASDLRPGRRASALRRSSSTKKIETRERYCQFHKIEEKIK